MKIIRILDRIGEDPSSGIPCARIVTDSVEIPCARVVTDSATVRNNRPMFIHDFARDGWVLELLPALHISRLGKWIAPRFAPRYIDGLSIVALLHRRDESAANSLYDIFDGALCLGERMEWKEDERLKISVVQRRIISGEELGRAEIEISTRQLRVEQTIAAVSRFCTLKSGDIILPGSLGLELPVEINTAVEVAVNGLSALITRLK